MTPERWARVKRVFHHALAQPADSRRAFAAAACGDDATLRDEVERLLRAHARAGDVIEPVPAGLEGRRLGRYEVTRLLGSGGMGEVYLARDVELGRNVALKVAGSGGGDPALRREAQLASRLNHPHICTVHDVGVFDGGAYVAMEYVEGRRLSDLVPAAGLAPADVVRYGAQIASALAHAHGHGIVHGDLKGANVMVTPDGRAKVLDFGLARLLPPAHPAASPSVTVSGQIAGTLPCMAPELLRGGKADARSDIWSLGVLLHELATGSKPFTGATPFELSAAILHRPPAAMPPHAPDALRHLVLRCLEKEPGDRWQTADAVRSAIEAVDLDASRLTVTTPAERRVSRVAAGIAAALVLAVAAASWRVWREPAPALAVDAEGRTALAVMPFDTMRTGPDDAWLSTGIQGMLLTGLAQMPGLDVISTQRLYEVARDAGAPSLDALDRTRMADVARRAGAGTAVVGSVFRTGDTVRLDARVEDLASGRVLTATSVTGTSLFAAVDQLALRIRDGIGLRDAGSPRPVSDVSSASLDAYRLYARGVDAFANMRLDDARALLERAVAIDPTFAEAYLQLALLSGPARRPADRGGYLRKAAEHRDRLTERQRLLMEVELARDEGRFADAATGLERLVEQFGDGDAATLAWQLHAPAVSPMPDVNRLLALAAKAAKADPRSPVARNVRGYALLSAGRAEEAVREFEAYAALAPREPNPHDSLGDAYLLMGRLDAARASYARAATIDPAFQPRGWPWTFAIEGRFEEALRQPGTPPYLSAVVLARAGRYGEAGRAVQQALLKAESGGDVVAVAGLHLLSALFAIEQARHAAALDAVRAAERALAPAPAERQRPSLALLHLIAGVAEVRSGRLAAARARLDALGALADATPQASPWWREALAGEVALAEGRLDAAAAAPAGKVFVSGLAEGSVLRNDLVFRDLPARVAKARGDLRGAVDGYRRLLTYDAAQRWVAVFEPRYVLEMARLLDQLGDVSAARTEYQRFLASWQRADGGLPEPGEARRAVARVGTQRPPGRP